MATVKAVAVIAGDKNVKGSLNFVQDSTGSTHVKGTISGLKPGPHGFHIHALGDTTNGCISTGPHFNPLNKQHGAPADSERHAGDLGNIIAASDGVAEISIRDSQIPLTGQHSILGRAVVVHADPDDLGRGGHELSKTTGNAGGRVGCGSNYSLCFVLDFPHGTQFDLWIIRFAWKWLMICFLNCCAGVIGLQSNV